MAVKGYTHSQQNEMRQKKLVKVTAYVGGSHLLLAAANIILMLFNIGIIAFLTVVIYIGLMGVYLHGVEMLSTEGYEKIKYFKIYKFISLIVYILSFISAFFTIL